MNVLTGPPTAGGVGLILGSVSSGARWFGCLYGETGDRFLVGVLGVAERHPGVDLQRGAGRVSGVGLDQGVVDALGFEPGEQEVPEPVRCHVVWEPGRGGVAGEQRADAASGVGLLPRALEQVRPTGLAAVADVQRERLGEGLRKRYDAVLGRSASWPTPQDAVVQDSVRECRPAGWPRSSTGGTGGSSVLSRLRPRRAGRRRPSSATAPARGRPPAEWSRRRSGCSPRRV